MEPRNTYLLRHRSTLQEVGTGWSAHKHIVVKVLDVLPIEHLVRRQQGTAIARPYTIYNPYYGLRVGLVCVCMCVCVFFVSFFFQ